MMDLLYLHRNVCKFVGLRLATAWVAPSHAWSFLAASWAANTSAQALAQAAPRHEWCALRCCLVPTQATPGSKPIWGLMPTKIIIDVHGRKGVHVRNL